MKKLLSVFILFALLVGLAACSGDTAAYEEQIDEYKQEIKELKQQIRDLEEQLAVYVPGDMPVQDGTGADSPAPPASSTLTLGQTVTIADVMEFTLTSWAWEDAILPSNTSGVYSYKGDNEDETYLVLRGTFTNLNGNSYDIDYLHESELLLNRKYSFDVQMDCEEPDGTGFSSVKPLQTVNFVIYASVSDGAKDIFENATVTLHILSDPSRTGYFFDKDDDRHNVYTITLTRDELSQ